MGCIFCIFRYCVYCLRYSETLGRIDLSIDIIVIPDICLEDGDVDVGVEAGLVREVAVDAAELGVVAEDGERVQGVDQPVSING